MGRPRSTAEDLATTERLLQAAEEEFGRAGFEGARLEDIARAAGITRPSLLYHFETKEELYAAVIHRAFAVLRDVLASAIGGSGSFEERLDRAVEKPLAFINERSALARLLLWELIEGQGPGHELLVAEIPPLLDFVERFVRKEGRGRVRAHLPVRAAILQLSAAAVVRTAAGARGEPIFGSVDHTLELARSLFLKE
jgi:AcrR family transcriptional regulator